MAALTVSELQALRDALIRARANGLREVRDNNGEGVTYKSDAEMRTALADLEAQIASATSALPKTIVFRTAWAD